jgi:CRP/FNR family transcriptional regulator, cyclic AMP receptor protein
MAAPTVAELASIPLFDALSTAEIEQIAPLFTVRSYSKGALIATEGDHLDMFNVILSGSIQWFWSDEDGRQLKLQPEGPGGHFADTTLGGEPILMSVSAAEPLRVASIPGSELKALLLRHPQVAVNLLMDVVARLRRTLRATKTLSMEEVYGRVVKLLLTQVVESDRPRVAENLTHVEIGRRVGATREMVGRILRDLARGGYIEMARGRITVLKKPPKRW